MIETSMGAPYGRVFGGHAQGKLLSVWLIAQGFEY